MTPLNLCASPARPPARDFFHDPPGSSSSSRLITVFVLRVGCSQLRSSPRSGRVSSLLHLYTTFTAEVSERQGSVFFIISFRPRFAQG